MRDRSSTRRSARQTLADDSQPPLQVSRTFDPAAIDLDDLAEAVRQLLGTDAENPRDPDLLLKRRRATHVMGSKRLEAPAS